MSAQWKDVTTYRRGEQDRTPRAWSLELGVLRIDVHRHIDYPGDWLMSCHALGVSGRKLDAKVVELAWEEALLSVDAQLVRMQRAVAKARGK